MPLAANPLIEVVPGLMIWTLIAFGITFFVLRRYAFGPVQKIIDERRQRIREALQEAERAREESRKLLEEHRGILEIVGRDVDDLLGHVGGHRDHAQVDDHVLVGKRMTCDREYEQRSALHGCTVTQDSHHVTPYRSSRWSTQIGTSVGTDTTGALHSVPSSVSLPRKSGGPPVVASENEPRCASH